MTGLPSVTMKDMNHYLQQPITLPQHGEKQGADDWVQKDG